MTQTAPRLVDGRIDARSDSNEDLQPARGVEAAALRRVVGPYQLFALALGMILGSAWLVMLGTWLASAGPLGTVIAFSAGALVMGIVAACYAELTSRIPKTGAEFTFVTHIFGRTSGFMVGWFLTLNLVAVVSFEAIAFYLMARNLVPGIIGPNLYAAFGENISADELVISLSACLGITWINYRGVRSAAIFQSVITYAFLLVVSVVIAFGFGLGHVANLKPLFPARPTSSTWMSVAWVFSTTTMFLTGFQAIPQAVEERGDGVSLRLVGNLTVASVIFAAAFMCLIAIASSMAVPWIELRGDPLAAATGVKHLLPHGLLSTVLLLAGAASVLKTWNVVVLVAARTLLAQAEAGVIPAWFAYIHPRFGSPTNSLLFIAVTSMIGILAGRGALVPVVNMSSMCLGAANTLCCAGLLLLRGGEPRSLAPYRVLGGAPVIALGALGTFGMTTVIGFHSVQESGGHLPVEWILMVVWAAIGWLFWTTTQKPRRPLPASLGEAP